jgi:hypothetical protein
LFDATGALAFPLVRKSAAARTGPIDAVMCTINPPGFSDRWPNCKEKCV